MGTDSPETQYLAFEALRPDLLRIARSMLRGSAARLDAEDLVQVTLAKIYAALKHGTLSREVESPRYFAYAALKRQFFDEVKRKSTQNEKLPPAEGDGRADPSATVPYQHLEINQLLAKFSEDERRFLCLVVFEGYGILEAQRECKWPPRSPHYHLKVLLARLREMIS